MGRWPELLGLLWIDWSMSWDTDWWSELFELLGLLWIDWSMTWDTDWWYELSELIRC
jgi:hypothetical protein